jgi:tripartite-type tricarboxylate transporter receptor subunit TctC
VTSAKRQPVLLEVPTAAQTGVAGTAGFEAVAWQSMVAPAGMPAELVDRYSELIGKVIAQPEFRERLEREGFEPEYRGPAALAAYIRSESSRWGAVVKTSGTQID